MRANEKCHGGTYLSVSSGITILHLEIGLEGGAAVCGPVKSKTIFHTTGE
jgi:hypothetical protein